MLALIEKLSIKQERPLFTHELPDQRNERRKLR
jgi:hypothetical protein